jgi:rfaE bifunctional protein kinase chain/domain
MLDLRDDAVDKFLIETDLDHGKKLTDGELRELERSRRAVAEALTPEDRASNALHLAKLYQHLRYIEEAKKAVQLSLGIDPDHMQGKQLFTELEKLHPVDIGAAPYSVSRQLTKSNLRKRIRQLSGGKVVVVGDLLIDELLEGKPERISREAPVLILEHVDTVLIPGGAANTAHNITALGGICHAVGVCGTDEYAGKLARILEGCQISHGLVPDPDRPTTVKTRILSKSHSLMQQLLRLDRISHEPLSPQVEARLVAKVQESVADYKAIILSDYKAGVITDGVIEVCRKAARAHNLLVIVDAQGDFERFKDVTIMTPNQPDAEKAVGFELKDMDSLSKAARHIFSATNAKALLITRGASGMALFQQGHEPVELPVFNRSDVFDVTGAGDTVVATMALALVSGASFVEATALGNLAAGIVVRKSGTAVTSQVEMLQNLERLDLPE